MGLIKLALIGGAGYFAGKKMTERQQAIAQSQGQNPQQAQPSSRRCSRWERPQHQDKHQQDSKQEMSQQHQQQQQNHYPYQPDYYNYNNVRGAADDDVYSPPPPNEKRQLPQLPQYEGYHDYERMPHEKPLQLNFVAPPEGKFPGSHIGGPGMLDRL